MFMKCEQTKAFTPSNLFIAKIRILTKAQNILWNHSNCLELHEIFFSSQALSITCTHTQTHNRTVYAACRRACPLERMQACVLVALFLINERKSKFLTESRTTKRSHTEHFAQKIAIPFSPFALLVMLLLMTWNNVTANRYSSIFRYFWWHISHELCAKRVGIKRFYFVEINKNQIRMKIWILWLLLISVLFLIRSFIQTDF